MAFVPPERPRYRLSYSAAGSEVKATHGGSTLRNSVIYQFCDTFGVWDTILNCHCL